MEKITFGELCSIIERHNAEHNIKSQYGAKENVLYAVIVFTEDSFDKPYTEQQRSYQIRNDEKYFLPNMNGTSLYSNCLDGSDLGVRLDWYMGGKDGWKVDYCYLIDKPIIA